MKLNCILLSGLLFALGTIASAAGAQVNQINGGVTLMVSISCGNYASGTMNVANAWCGAAAEDGQTPYWDSVKYTKLAVDIGGESAGYKTGPAFPQPFGNYGVMWDSTHFAPGGGVIVQATVTFSLTKNSPPDSAIVTIPALVAIPIKNRFLFAQHPDAEMAGEPVNTVEPMTPTSKFERTTLTGYWTGTEFVNDLAGASAVFVGSHGLLDTFYAGWTWIDGPDTTITVVHPSGPDHTVVGHSEWVDMVGIEPHRLPQMGTGLPFSNSTGNPPISVAIIVACGTGADDQFNRFLLPYQHEFGSLNDDQCEIGFAPSIFIYTMQQLGSVLMTSLLAGKTAWQARKDLLDLNILCPTGHLNTAATVPVYGDFNTRLTTVYTKSDIPPIGWWRVI